jgi:cytochrome c553
MNPRPYTQTRARHALPRQLLLTITSAGLVLSAALVAAVAQQPGQPDPERAFAFGDSNLDGKLSLEEFRELLTNGARLKKAAKKSLPEARLTPLFRRLDTNRDGELSVKEYRQITELRAAAGGGPLGKKIGAGPLAGGALAKRRAAANATPAARPNARPVPTQSAAVPVTLAQARFFETKVRPVLMTKCAKCHSQAAEKIKGGLLIDSREGLRKGGDTGAAIVPGKPDESLLITAIRYTDDSLQMPPNGPLPQSVVADFEAWVKMGAPDPRGASAPKAALDTSKARQFWSFQPPRIVNPPPPKDTAWPRSDLDRFLLAALEAKGLKPVADADKPTLIRRVTFDLTGLPPTPQEFEAFLADHSADAFKNVVERLLASPRFGERWGRHWLDVARFAESSGKANMLYPNAWRYRDWVIAAFNEDKPFDAFIREQLAGDLEKAGNDRRRAELAVATGFLALGSKTHNTQNRQQFVVDLADEQIEVTSQAFLGLTIACARCHDHKFDPISQRDYYALSGIFQSTQTCYGTLPGVVQNTNPSPLIELPPDAGQPSAMPKLSSERRKALEEQVAELVRTRDSLSMEENFTLKGIRTRTLLAMQRFRLASFKPDGTPRSYAMGVRDRFEPIDSPLYARGELESPAEVVPRGLILMASSTASAAVKRGSGRLELAEWIASRQNPLTARVMVNRIWLHLFGRGLVATPDNFGASGQPPDHPELLDALAISFMDQGWSVKKLIRQIVLSRAYQLASTHDARNFEADPDNTLVWRMSKKRLEAEAVRDAILSASGRLVVKPPVGSAVALAGEGRVGPLRRFNQDGPNLHRAVYLPVVRDQVPESLTLFDFPDPSLSTGKRAETSGPAQALYLMNNPFVIRQAKAAAELVRSSSENDDERIRAAYVRFLSRNPSAAETARARDFLAKFPPPKDRGDHQLAAWTAFCQALYASAEFRYLD